MARVGGLLPSTAKGHCGFTTNPDGSGLCGAPASLHLLVHHPEGMSGIFACEAHAGHALSVTDPIDHHPVDYECTRVGASWLTSTPTRRGYCSTPDADASAIAGLRDEPVKAGA
jgi:hypothetical protein